MSATGNPTSKVTGKIGVGTIIGFGFDAFDVGSTYLQNRKEGHGVGYSIGAAAFEQALWTFAPALQWTRFGISLAEGIGSSVGNYSRNQGKVIADMQNSQYSRQFGGKFVDSQNGATMRQRGVNALQRSGQNVNSVLGSEARTYFRGVY